MAFVLKDGQGTLFRNNKEKDSHPDYKGEVMIDGRTYEIAGWKKEGNKTTWVSLSVKLRAEREREKRTEAQKYRDKDDIPF